MNKLTPEKLDLFEIPYLELLDEVIRTEYTLLVNDEVRESIVLDFGKAVKTAVEMRKEEYNERRNAEANHGNDTESDTRTGDSSAGGIGC